MIHIDLAEKDKNYEIYADIPGVFHQITHLILGSAHLEASRVRRYCCIMDEHFDVANGIPPANTRAYMHALLSKQQRTIHFEHPGDSATSPCRQLFKLTCVCDRFPGVNKDAIKLKVTLFGAIQSAAS